MKNAFSNLCLNTSEDSNKVDFSLASQIIEKFSQPIGGYELTEVVDAYKRLNADHLQVMDRIEEIIKRDEIYDEDKEYLADCDLFFNKISLNRRCKMEYDADIFESVLHATLIETYNRSKIFFGNDDANYWKLKEKEYKAYFIKKGCYVEFMIKLIGSLYYNQKSIYDAFNTDFENKEDFSEFYDISNLINYVEENNEYKDLNRRRLYFVDEIINCKKFYLVISPKTKNDNFHKAYNAFIENCEKYIELIDYEIKNKCVPENNTKVTDITNKIPTSNNYRIASKRKTDVVKILSAMYDSRMFVDANNKPITNKQELMEAFGDFFNEDLSSYSSLLTQAKNKDHDTFFKPFDQINRAITKYYEGE